METKIKQDEELLAAHLAAITVASFLFLLLIVETVVMGWESWAIPFLVAATIALWFCHLSRSIPLSLRVPVYVVTMLGVFFFYGIHKDSLFDVPIIAIIMLSVFLTLECDWAVYVGAGMYAMVLLWQLLVLRNYEALRGQLEFSRLVLDIVAVTVATLSTRDVSNRRRKSNARVNAAVAQLEELNRQTEDFMANVSHEFRTPINAVMGISESLLKKEGNTQKRTELLAIKRAGHRLFNQISDILDYTEIGMGRLKLSDAPYRIDSCINDVMSELRALDEKPSVELVLDVDIKTPAVMVGDEGKIKKVLRHLIENAMKFTQEGGVYVRVSYLKKEYGVNLFITVSDTGSGMREELLGKIFGRLYQANSDRTRRSGGIGLGLTVVSGLVRRMGGFVQVRSEIGKGTEIHVSIPQKVSDDSPCMSISNEKSLCVAYYFLTEKFSNPMVREYYERMVTTIQDSMPGTLIRASDFEALERICQQYPLTHIFTTRDEYKVHTDFFKGLASRISVIIIVGREFPDSRLDGIPIIKKPLFSIPLVNVLNGEFLSEEAVATQHFICPGVRALVVDDDEMNLMVAEGVLKDYQMDVTLAISGKNAVELCKRRDFDIVFLDHMMPEMDGIECSHIIRRLSPHAQKDMVIIAFTANAVSGARELFLGEGFDEFLAKPIEVTTLERVLKRTLPASMIKPVTEGLARQKSVEPDFYESLDGFDEAQLLERLSDALDCLEEDRAVRILNRLNPAGYKDIEAAVNQFDFEGASAKLSLLTGGKYGSQA
ncbi:MAG: response regulator [Treponema sp.]|nr:response regulator [Treponema sp.]